MRTVPPSVPRTPSGAPLVNPMLVSTSPWGAADAPPSRRLSTALSPAQEQRIMRVCLLRDVPVATFLREALCLYDFHCHGGSFKGETLVAPDTAPLDGFPVYDVRMRPRQWKTEYPMLASRKGAHVRIWLSASIAAVCAHLTDHPDDSRVLASLTPPESWLRESRVFSVPLSLTPEALTVLDLLSARLGEPRESLLGRIPFAVNSRTLRIYCPGVSAEPEKN